MAEESENDRGPVHPRRAMGRRRETRGEDGADGRESELEKPEPGEGSRKVREEVPASTVRPRGAPFRARGCVDAPVRQTVPLGTMNPYIWGKIWSATLAWRPLGSMTVIVTVYCD